VLFANPAPANDHTLPLPARPRFVSENAYSNICRCRFSTDAEKKDHLDALAEAPTRLAAKDTHDRRRTGRLRKGPAPGGMSSGEGLGTLVNEQVFKEKLYIASGLSYSDFNRIYGSWLRYWAKIAEGKRPTATERLDAAPILRSVIAVKGDGHVWLFRGSRRSGNPFAGESNKWLGARLGLRIPPSGEFRLTIAFAAKDVRELTEPRFIDPTWNYLPLWDWSGRTRPIAGTPAKYGGYDELVAAAPPIGKIAYPVRRIKIAAAVV
jgi:hypothetical protein